MECVFCGKILPTKTVRQWLVILRAARLKDKKIGGPFCGRKCFNKHRSMVIKVSDADLIEAENNRKSFLKIVESGKVFLNNGKI